MNLWSEALNEQYLDRAKSQVSDVRLLINAAARRSAELARGGRPLVPVPPGAHDDFLDIALLEIAEGKLKIVQKAPEEE